MNARARFYSVLASVCLLVVVALLMRWDRNERVFGDASARDPELAKTARTEWQKGIVTPPSISLADSQAAVRFEDALARGVPLRVSASGSPEIPSFDLLVRPMRALADEFQITVGSDFDSALEAAPQVFEGWAVSHTGGRRGRATVAIINGAIAAVVQEADGAMIELKTDAVTGGYRALRLGADSLDAECSLSPSEFGSVATVASAAEGFTDDDWGPIEIAPQWGSDPATGEITKYEQPIPNGELYDLSLPEATVMVVLAKDATGDDSSTNLASIASTYLARMANVATIWENQLGIRLLVSELILTPDTPAFEDVGESLDDFRVWGETNRPRLLYPRALATRFGNLGFSGNTVGFGYVGGIASPGGYSINKTNYNFTLVAHEMGHNFGSNHSSGGIMNATLRQGQRDFFRDVSSGETAAKDIYDHAKDRLLGPATMRHAEEIPFAADDALSTDLDVPLFFEPLANDLESVRNGATNTLSVAELSRVYPIDAGTVEVVEDSYVVFTPSSGFEGFAWFSYSLQGDVGNGGEGWLHRGDVSVLVGTDPTDDLNITLAPGESIIFDPPGSGSATITTAPTQALADVTRDDNELLVVRARDDATGGDSFVVSRSGVHHTINVTYAPRPPQVVPDVIVVEPGVAVVRFNPMSNDEAIGYRRARQLDARVGFDGTSESYFANSLRLVEANNLNPEKGSLTLEALPLVVGGTAVNAPNGFMRFVPAAGATGVAQIDYTIEDAAGNQSTGTIAFVLSLLEIAQPNSATVNVPEDVGLLLVASTHSVAAGALSGEVGVQWEVASEPAGGGASFANPTAAGTSVQFSAPGSYVLRATGTDSGYSTMRELAVLVTDTAPNGENLGALVDLADSVLMHGTADPFDLSAAIVSLSDEGLPSPPAALTTTWSQVSGPGPVVFADAGDPNTTAVFPSPGDYDLRLEADDGELTTFDLVTITYSGPGDGRPGTSGIADVRVATGASPFVLDLFPAFEDAEDDDATLIYTLGGNTNPALFSSAVIADDPEQLTLSFASAVAGTSVLTVRATDSDGFFVDASFTVVVADSAPIIAPIADQSVAEGQSLTLTVTATDLEAGNLTYGLVAGSPAGMSIDPASGALSWTPGEAAGPGTHPVMVRVVDGSPAALSATELFLVDVAEVNQAPDLAAIDDVFGFAQTEFTIVASVSDLDLPANSLRYYLDVNPAGASIDSQDGTIRWTPTGAGTYDFTVRVDDRGAPNLSDTESFSVDVVNGAPAMADQSFTIPENSPGGTEVGTVLANDGDGDPFSFLISGGDPGGAFLIDSDTGALAVAAGAVLDFEVTPSLDLTVAVTDEGTPPLTRTATVTIDLSDVNEAPSLPDQTLAIAIGEEFGAVVGSVQANDPEGGSLTFSILSGNEAGIFALDSSTGELSIAAQATLTASPVLTISVADDGAPALEDSGDVTLVLTQVLVADPAAVRVFVPGDGSLASVWKDAAFDDSAWTSGQSGVGYERDSGYESLINTDVEAEMYNVNSSVWIRVPFDVADPAALATLTLRMKYDDGFVASINGVEVARRNVPVGDPDWDAAATAGHDDVQAVEFEDIDVGAAIGSLATGANMLAIHGLNADLGGSDMLIRPELVATGSGTIGVTALPQLATGSASGITTVGALLEGDLLFAGGESPEVFAAWGTTDGGTDPGAWDDTQSVGVLGEGAFTLPIGGLLGDTGYWFRFYATNSAGTAWSDPSGSFSSTPVLQNETLIATEATARWLVPADASEGTAWRDFGFDDAGWASGATGIGYERSSGYEQLIETDVEAAMFNQNTTIYLRLPFELVDPASLTSLTLRMKYDDAYVAFVNGTEVARSSGVPATLSWDAGATTQHLDPAAVVFEDVDILTAASDYLVEGANVLAIHGLNAGGTSSDLLFVPELVTSYPQLSYPGWVSAFPELEGEERLQSSDPDGDGLSNFLEFAFGLNPAFPETEGQGNGLVRPQITRTAVGPPLPGGGFEIRYRRRIDYQSQGLIYEVETCDIPSRDDFDWFPAFAFPTGEAVPTGDGVTEEVTVMVESLDLGAAPRLFFRVVVFGADGGEPN